MLSFNGIRSRRRGGHARRGMVRASTWLAAAIAMPAAGADQLAEARLDEVFVTATRRAQAMRDVPAAAAVVTREDIDDTGAPDVLSAIRDTAGIGLIGQSVAGRKTMSLRGMDGKHTLYLVDGLRVINTDDWVGHSDFQYDWTPMDGVARIEVLRGPMSVLYGSDALGGVVNVIARRPDAHWRGKVRVDGRVADGAGGGNSASGGVFLSGALTDSLRMAFSATRLQRAPLERKEDKRISEVEGSDLQAGRLLLSWQPHAAHTVDIEHSSADDRRQRDQVRGAIQYRDSYDIERSRSVATWRADWGSANSQLRVWESDFSISNKRTMGVAPTRPQSLDERGADGYLGFALGDRQFLTAGIDTRKETMSNAGLRGGEADASFKAFYLQDEIALRPDLVLSLGFRRDRHDIFGAENSPRAYLVWHATKNWTVRGGYGEGFRAPTLKQASSSYEGAEGPHTFYGNSAIRPETSKSWELGVVHEGESFDWEATAFRNTVRDLITTREIAREGPRRIYIYDNIHNARITGVEAALGADLGRGFSVRVNGQWLDSKDADSGKPLNGRPDHLLNAALNWKQGGWNAGLRVEYTGRQYITQARKKAPAYSLVNLNVGYQLNPHLRFVAGIDNLTNVYLAEKSDLFSYSETPRTLRLAIHGAF